MRKIIFLSALIAGFVVWRVNAATCTATATVTGCPVSCIVYIVNGTAACTDGDCSAECKTWDQDGNPIDHEYYACDNCSTGSGSGGGGSAGAGTGGCDYGQPMYWLYCDPWAM